MKYKLLIILILVASFNTNAFSRCETECLLKVMEIVNNTGGVGRFDQATFRKVIVFKGGNLYKTFILSYDWNEIRNDIVGYDEDGYINEVLGWTSYEHITYLPARYFEEKISDFDSDEYFVNHLKEMLCDDNHFSECNYAQLTLPNDIFKKIKGRIDEQKFEKEVLDCMQKNKNEVLSVKTIKIEEDKPPYIISNIPKMWGCIYHGPSDFFIKARYYIRD